MATFHIQLVVNEACRRSATLSCVFFFFSAHVSTYDGQCWSVLQESCCLHL